METNIGPRKKKGVILNTFLLITAVSLQQPFSADPNMAIVGRILLRSLLWKVFTTGILKNFFLVNNVNTFQLDRVFVSKKLY